MTSSRFKFFYEIFIQFYNFLWANTNTLFVVAVDILRCHLPYLSRIHSILVFIEVPLHTNTDEVKMVGNGHWAFSIYFHSLLWSSSYQTLMLVNTVFSLVLSHIFTTRRISLSVVEDNVAPGYFHLTPETFGSF